MAPTKQRCISTNCRTIFLFLTLIIPSVLTQKEEMDERVEYSGDGEEDGDMDDDGDIWSDGNENSIAGNTANHTSLPNTEAVNTTIASHPHPHASDYTTSPPKPHHCIKKASSKESMICDYFSNTEDVVKAPTHLAEHGIKNLEIIGASILHFHPLCLSEIRFTSCSKINHIDYGPASGCHPLSKMSIHNSSVEKLTGSFQEVEIFDSHIRSLSVASVSDDEEAERPVLLSNVTIKNLHGFVIQGSSFLKMSHSRIDIVYGNLMLNSSRNILNAIIASDLSVVHAKGFSVIDGHLLIENSTIHDLDSGGIIISGHGLLILKNVVLKKAHTNGLVLMVGGRVIFDNVTANNINIKKKEFDSMGGQVYILRVSAAAKHSFLTTPLGIFIITVLAILTIVCLCCITAIVILRRRNYIFYAI
ncbi:uncharacterized protein [Cherax quadricarinatus]|uniref:uncharacterized protein n=1 Tax=Cherax quadricarinatus TaxID=27406 RepID=UPI002378D18F|nr:uncharacterized protein LOC128701973 [Cherax quadricarinatus]